MIRCSLYPSSLWTTAASEREGREPDIDASTREPLLVDTLETSRTVSPRAKVWPREAAVSPKPQFPDRGLKLKFLHRKPGQMSPGQLHRVPWGPSAMQGATEHAWKEQ